MIHYRYSHTGDGYEKKLNIPQEHADYEYGMNVFETLRTSVEGRSITYAVSDGKDYVLLKSGSQNNQTYLEGVSDDLRTLNFSPVRFVDGFRILPSTQPSQTSVVPASSLAPSLSLATFLHHAFGKIIDALLYGDAQKQIVIVADNDDAIKYLKVVSLILPTSYMKKIGFSYGCTAIPDMRYDIQRGASVVPMNVRIVVPDMKDFNFEYYASTAYVFDLRGRGKDNYGEPLHSVGKLFEELDFGKTTICENYIQKIKEAFNDDGSVNYELLDRIAYLSVFELKNDLPTAIDILKNRPGEQDIVSKALNVMLSDENAKALTGDDRKLIVNAYLRNPSASEGIEEKYCNYLISSFRSLSEDEKKAFYKIVAAKKDASRLATFLEPVRYMEYASISGAFDDTVEIIKTFIGNNGAELSGLKNFLRVAIDNFALKNFINKVPMANKTNGEAFFDRVLEEEDFKLRVLLTSVLMASAYRTNASDAELEVRIRGLKKVTDKSLYIADKIHFICSVKTELEEIDVLIPELGLKSPVDFVFNHNYGKHWLTEVVRNAQFSEMLEIYEKVHLQTQDGYESLQNCILVKLLNTDYVCRNVQIGQDVFENYYKFYYHILPQSVRESHSDISAYLDGLMHEQGINDEFAKYRYDFAYECYKTLSANHKKKIASDLGTEVSSYGETDKAKRADVVEHTIEEFGIQNQLPKGKGKKRKPFALWAFGFGVLSGILVILPAIIQALVLNRTDFTQISGSINPLYAFVPLYVFLLHVCVYGCLKSRNKLKEANIITLLCGILPVLAFVVAQIVFFYSGIKIDLTFLQ